MAEKIASIHLSPEVRDRLRAEKVGSETYLQTVDRILNEHE